MYCRIEQAEGAFVSRVEVLGSWRSLASLVLRRPGEFRDRTIGYADLGLDRLFGAPPAYETVSWENALFHIF